MFGLHDIFVVSCPNCDCELAQAHTYHLCFPGTILKAFLLLLFTTFKLWSQYGQGQLHAHMNMKSLHLTYLIHTSYGLMVIEKHPYFFI